MGGHFLSKQRVLIYLNIIAVIMVSLTTSSLPVNACIGAKAIALGESFVALADNPTALYWNPAGLSFQSGLAIDMAFTDSPGGHNNYDNYLILSDSRNEKYSGALGFLRDDSLSSPSYYSGLNGLTSRNTYMYSVAARLSQGAAIGGTVKYETVIDRFDDGISPDRTGQAIGFDVGLMAHLTEHLRLGLLLQDINQPSIVWNDGLNEVYGINIRPGIAWISKSGTTVSAEAYNLGGGLIKGTSIASPEIRAGIERTFSIKTRRDGRLDFAARLGTDMSIDGDKKLITAGTGLNYQTVSEKTNLRIDYAYRHNLNDDYSNDTHIVSIGASF